MATDDAPGNGNGTRISLSEKRVTEIVENAVLKLQLALAESFASKDALTAALARADSQDKRMESQDRKIESLEQDKAGREAVTNYKKWLTGGAVLGTLFMLIQVAISLYLVTHK